MIARIWRGVVRLDDADEYANYIRDTGFTEYGRPRGIAAPGCFAGTKATEPSSSPCRCGTPLTRSAPSPATISRPPSSTPEDARYLVGESTVTHYQVVDRVEDPSGPGEEQ
jgi:hypothetical protein